MASLNKVILIGNLGADPELKHVNGDRAVCSLSLATNEKFKGRDGEMNEKTEWHRVTVWGDTAENVAKYLAKGRSVYIEGRLQTRSWEKDGQRHFSTEIVADRVLFLGGGGGEGQRSGAEAPNPGRRERGGWGGGGNSGGAPSDGGDDIPF